MTRPPENLVPPVRRILVIEDNLDSVHTTCMLLREMGHNVDYATNGYVALEAARRFRPEFVLLDLGLPGLTGYEVARQIKRDPELTSVRIFTLTGYNDAESKQRADRAGFDGYFVKPLDPKVLAEMFGDLKVAAK